MSVPYSFVRDIWWPWVKQKEKLPIQSLGIWKLIRFNWINYRGSKPYQQMGTKIDCRSIWLVRFVCRSLSGTNSQIFEFTFWFLLTLHKPLRTWFISSRSWGKRRLTPSRVLRSGVCRWPFSESFLKGLIKHVILENLWGSQHWPREILQAQDATTSKLQGHWGELPASWWQLLVWFLPSVEALCKSSRFLGFRNDM